MDVLARLEKDWLAARKKKRFKELGEILKICAKHCADDKGIKRLNKWVEFLESSVNDIPLSDLSKILSIINYARTIIDKAGTGHAGESSGQYLTGTLTANARRSASRTLNNPMVRNLKNDHSEIGDDTDLSLERRSNRMDTERRDRD